MGKKKSKPRVKHIPQRTCLVCRQKTDKRELTRIVRTPEGAVLVDPTGKQNGRGAYLCTKQSCWQAIQAHSGLLERALKTKVSQSDLAAIAAAQPGTEPGKRK